MTQHDLRLLRIVFSGLNDIEEWKLGDADRARAKGYPRAHAADALDDFGIVFVDMTLDARTGRPICHEVNGPNGVGSDALTGESSLRADNEARQAVRRAREMGLLDGDGRVLQPVVTIHAHQHWRAFRTGGEFYPRVRQFADRLEASLPGNELCLRGGGEALGAERIAAVVGDVPAVAADLDIDHGRRRLQYQGRPVIFAGNPNLVPELVRLGRLRWDDRRTLDVDARVFHAWRLVHVFHDKALQQRLLEGTGIAPLRHFEAWTIDETLRRAKAMLAGGAVVLKPNGASGGAGVHVVVPGMRDEEIVARIAAVVTDCVDKYGDNAEAVLFPIRGFEFVSSTPYPMADGGHLWDLRIAVLFAPGVAQVFPISIRVAPAPFDEATFHLDRDQWVSNVSGREGTLLASGMDDAALTAVGMTPDKLDDVFEACVEWTRAAWLASVRDAALAESYEDGCERADPAFYPRHKFRM